MRKNDPKRGTILRVLRCTKRYLPLMILSLLLAAATVALSLYVPIRIGNAIDRILGPGKVEFAPLFKILSETGLLIGIGGVLQWCMTLLNNRVTYRVVRDVRAAAFEKLQRLPLSYLDRRAVGDTVSRVITDADQFADGLLMGFSQLFTGVATILGTIGFMFSIRWQIALVVILLTPVSLFVARFIARKTYAMFLLQSETRAEQTSLIDEAVTGQKTIQAFSREKAILEKFDEVNGRLEHASVRATFFSSITNPSTRFVNSLVYAGVGLAGALTCIATAGAAVPFTVGQLSCFLSYANQYTKPFNEISGVITELQNALACAARLFELIDAEPQSPDVETQLLKEVQGRVELQNVSFSYVPEKPLIEHLNLSVQPGQKVAIVGPTGCGKTTLINLLMRFYDVDDGAVLIEERDVRQISRHSLRRAYGMVLQDTWLRSGTIRENLLFGRPEATEAEMITAAENAHADSFIRRLPKGYETVIGEDGGILSAGQKQLLCIARVMLAHPPMLILDEATSSIDTRTELKVQEVVDRLMEGRTCFVVAHRLSTIREADVILVMRDGHIVEQGDHLSLLRQNGFYTELYQSQFVP